MGGARRIKVKIKNALSTEKSKNLKRRHYMGDPDEEGRTGQYSNGSYNRLWGLIRRETDFCEKGKESSVQKSGEVLSSPEFLLQTNCVPWMLC